MNMPTHPPRVDEPAAPRSRHRAIVIATCMVVVLVGLHMLRTALG